MVEINHPGTQPIETERLILRRFTLDDAQQMYDNWACDPVVTRYLTWPPHENVEGTRYVLNLWLTEYANNPDSYNWAITLRDSGEVIGSIGLLHFDEKNQKAEAGYCMGRQWWGSGIMTEALHGVLDYAFRTIGLHRVQARHDTHNPASGRVMQKAGMSFEGIDRQSSLKHGEFRDCARYAILANEWRK